MKDFFVKTSYSFLLFGLIFGNASAGDFTHSRYDDMKTDFLNVNTSNIKIVDMSEMDNLDAFNGFNNADNNPYEIEFDDKNFTGSNSWCTNEFGEDTFCFEASGSTGDFSKTRFWLGVGDGNNHVSTVMFGVGDTEKPVNLWCVEYELDPTKVTYFSQTYADNPKYVQTVNQSVSHDDLEHHEISVGTYTSPFKNDTQSVDKETGGTFNSGGNTHFYHQGYSYGRYTNIRTFALSSKTFVGCFGPNPRGIRSGGRPPFNSNPLMTVVGDNAEGQTDGYSYWNYVTRFYWDLESDNNASVTYPFTMKINKFWMMYEENDVLAYSGNGSVLGVDMVETGNTAIYPFVVDNDANDDRDYRLSFMAGGNLPLKPGREEPHFRVFVDENEDQVLDGGDTEIFTGDFISFTANTNKHFLIAHTPDFNDGEATEVRWSRNFAPANVLFRERDRLRYASYSVRTWEGSATDVTNKATILPTMVYQAPDTEYETYAAFNQDKPNNPRLIRNSPDFKRAMADRPLPPTDVTIN